MIRCCCWYSPRRWRPGGHCTTNSIHQTIVPSRPSRRISHRPKSRHYRCEWCNNNHPWDRPVWWSSSRCLRWGVPWRHTIVAIPVSYKTQIQNERKVRSGEKSVPGVTFRRRVTWNVVCCWRTCFEWEKRLNYPLDPWVVGLVDVPW